MVRANKKAAANEKKEYIRNYASESGGKTPTGQCRNVGLPKRKPINTTSNGTSSPNYSFISPSLVRVGLPRLNKTPNSNSRLNFKSPLITTPTAIESPVSTDNEKVNTPVRTSDRSRVKKKLQEDFNASNETHKDPVTTPPPVTSDKVEIINEPILEASGNDNEPKKKQKTKKEISKTDSKQSSKKRKRNAELEDQNNISSKSAFTSLPKESTPKRTSPRNSIINKVSPNCPVLEPQVSRSFKTTKDDMCPLTALMKNKVMYNNTDSAEQVKDKENTKQSQKCPKLEPQVNRTKKLILKQDNNMKCNTLSSISSTDEEDSIPLASIIQKRIVVPEKHIISHKLSLKKSNNSMNSIKSIEIDNSNKTSAQTIPRNASRDMDVLRISAENISRNKRTENDLTSEVKKLQEDIKEKMLKLDSLNRTKGTKQNCNVEELNKLINVWEDGCKNALVALHKKINQLGKKVSMEGLLSNFQIPQDRFKFDV